MVSPSKRDARDLWRSVLTTVPGVETFARELPTLSFLSDSCWLSTLCRPGGVREAPTIDSEEAAALVAAQAQAVRRLKEEDGLTNDDEEVQQAVAELKRLKALVPE